MDLPWLGLLATATTACAVAAYMYVPASVVRDVVALYAPVPAPAQRPVMRKCADLQPQGVTR